MKFAVLILASLTLGCAARHVSAPPIRPARGHVLHIEFRNLHRIDAEGEQNRYSCDIPKEGWIVDAKSGGWIAVCR